MTITATIPHAGKAADTPSRWLKRYYFTRFAFSAVWVLMALAAARHMPALAALMLVGYPAWDAIANFADAQRSGDFWQNQAQLLNFVVSIITAVAVAVALGRGMNEVLLVFGVWAGLAGLLQLATAVRRWRTTGAQWAMVLSGAQSALAAAFMIRMVGGSEPVGIANIAPYAAFGAFYFLVSAVWLTVSDARKAARAA